MSLTATDSPNRAGPPSPAWPARIVHADAAAQYRADYNRMPGTKYTAPLSFARKLAEQVRWPRSTT